MLCAVQLLLHLSLDSPGYRFCHVKEIWDKPCNFGYSFYSYYSNYSHSDERYEPANENLNSVTRGGEDSPVLKICSAGSGHSRGSAGIRIGVGMDLARAPWQLLPLYPSTAVVSWLCGEHCTYKTAMQK